MKLLAALSVVFATQGVLASEVGTQNPESVESEKSIELALADKGASTSWTIEPLNFEATAHQTAELNKHVDAMNQQVSENLEAIIAKRLEQSLAR